MKLSCLSVAKFLRKFILKNVSKLPLGSDFLNFLSFSNITKIPVAFKVEIRTI